MAGGAPCPCFRCADRDASHPGASRIAPDRPPTPPGPYKGKSVVEENPLEREIPYYKGKYLIREIHCKGPARRLGTMAAVACSCALRRFSVDLSRQLRVSQASRIVGVLALGNSMCVYIYIYIYPCIIIHM